MLNVVNVNNVGNVNNVVGSTFDLIHTLFKSATLTTFNHIDPI